MGYNVFRQVVDRDSPRGVKVHGGASLKPVANEVGISKVDLDPELVEAVERGAHYLCRVEV